jgi:hypothetical protein
MKFPVLLAVARLALAVASRTYAQSSVSAAAHEASASLSVTFNSSNNQVTFVYSIDGDGSVDGSGGTHYAYVEAYLVSASGAMGGTQLFSRACDGNPINSRTNATQGSYPATSGQWIRLVAGCSADGSHVSLGTQEKYAWYQVGAPQTQHKVTVSLFNKRTVPVRYKLMQGSTQIGQVTLQPNTGLIQTFVTQNADPVSVFEEIDGLSKDGTSWVEVPGATHSEKVGEVTPTSVPENQTPPSVSVPQAPNVPTNITPTPAPSKQPIWRSVPINNDPTQQKDLLTNAIYREGVDKTVEAINQGREELKPEDVPAKESGFKAAIDATVQKVQQKADADWAQHVGDSPTLANDVAGSISGSTEWPTVSIPLLGTIEFSPYKIPWLMPVLNAAREIILWLMVYGFVYHGIRRANEYELQLVTVTPPPTTMTAAELVPAAGQLVAWLKGTLTALGIVTACIVAYGAAVLLINTHIMAIVGYGWKIVTSGGNVLSNALGSAASNPFWKLAQEFFPLNAFFQLMGADLVLTFSMGKIFILASGIVRAIRA